MSWSDPASRPVNEHGSKARVGLVPKSAYSDWRRTVGHGCYANDVDWLEWRADAAGEVVIVAIIETTTYEDKPELRPCLPAYRAAALARFKRDAQYAITQLVARLAGAPAFFVVMRDDLQVFHVCRLRDEVWREWSEAEYRQWILSLGRPVAFSRAV